MAGPWSGMMEINAHDEGIALPAGQLAAADVV
jgi:hypothetical protein